MSPPTQRPQPSDSVRPTKITWSTSIKHQTDPSIRISGLLILITTAYRPSIGTILCAEGWCCLKQSPWLLGTILDGSPLKPRIAACWHSFCQPLKDDRPSQHHLVLIQQLSELFLSTRQTVRDSREQVDAQTGLVREARERLEHVPREDTRFLELTTQEHHLLLEERQLRMAYAKAAETEREAFVWFSVAVQDAHTKERTRAERTKHWSIVGSLTGAILGLFGSAYLNRLRLRELHSIVGQGSPGLVGDQERLDGIMKQQTECQKRIEEMLRDLQSRIAAKSPHQELKDGFKDALASSSTAETKSAIAIRHSVLITATTVGLFGMGLILYFLPKQ
uniref:Coiled-coil domain-containing protein 51 n=1 Tax=Eptatretus burgeri TaxID=7764 RepID=A0A8C4WTG6_EPTBU